MIDIKTIPLSELRADLLDSYTDIKDCMASLLLGIKTYGNNKDVQTRLNDNRGFIVKIEEELDRRGEAYE